MFYFSNQVIKKPITCLKPSTRGQTNEYDNGQLRVMRGSSRSQRANGQPIMIIYYLTNEINYYFYNKLQVFNFFPLKKGDKES